MLSLAAAAGAPNPAAVAAVSAAGVAGAVGEGAAGRSAAGRSAAGEGGTGNAAATYREEHRRLVEDAIKRGSALWMRYASQELGLTRARVVSAQCLVEWPHLHFLAHCHRRGELRYFRVSRMQHAKLTADTSYVKVSIGDIRAYLENSVNGYHDPIEPVAVAFFVRAPELRWVVDTLPLAMQVEAVPGGVRLSGRTAGIATLARYVVGLGAAARAETPELARAVHELARGAVAANSPPIRSVTAIRSGELAGGGR